MIFGILAIGLIFYFISIQQDDYGKSFKGETIGLVTRIEDSGKHRKLKYYFYTDKKILSQIQTREYKGDPYDLIDKFFKVKYDLNDPEQNLIILEDELESDSIKLVKAGFTKTRYYEYDDVKAEYLGKWKWK